jgi:hypothetical protein
MHPMRTIQQSKMRDEGKGITYEVTHISETRVLLCPQCIKMFVFTWAHEPVEKLCLFLVGPMSGATGGVLAHLGIVRVVIVDIGSSLLASGLGVL